MNLARLRIERGLTIEQMTLLCGMTHPQYQKIERGREDANVTLVTLSRFAEALRVEIGELLATQKSKKKSARSP